MRERLGASAGNIADIATAAPYVALGTTREWLDAADRLAEREASRPG